MQQIDIQNAVINLSKDDFGYERVLKNFENVREMNIVTYNISSKESELIKGLQRLNASVTVNIITNIPNRFESYYSPKNSKAISPAQRALKSIEHYCNTLDPRNFSCDVTLYFNFENHSKIIATDNVAYIGSANFSDESQNNIEAGIIITNKDDLAKVNHLLIPEIINSSIRYSTSYYKIINEFMKEKLKEVARIVIRIDEGLFTWREVGYGNEEKVLDIYQGAISKKEWDEFTEFWGSVEDLILEVVDGFGDKVNMTSIQSCLLMLEQKVKFIENTLQEIVLFNPDIFDVAQESPLYSTGEPEDLEKAFQFAQEKINEEREGIIQKFGEMAKEIEDTLHEIPQLVKEINMGLDEIAEELSEIIIYENQWKINNTGEMSQKI